MDETWQQIRDAARELDEITEHWYQTGERPADALLNIRRVVREQLLPLDDYDIREQVADDIETPDSELCDCGREENPPIGRMIGRDEHGQPVYKPLAHHCECRAVLTSATVRRGKTMTLHERECHDHGYGEHYRG